MNRITGLCNLGEFHIDVEDSEVLRHVAALNSLPGVVNVSVSILDSDSER